MIDLPHVHDVDDIYIIYSDWLCHVEDHDNAMYIFIHVADNGHPLSICPEDEIANLLDVLEIMDLCYPPVMASETP
ncbi:hypothetical protein BKA82DRAFT_4355356 [Pisolithus tinctorius]|nr:hypothetical protein BKA82DRAFT_4355356 [Pisolithus tinctorius]